MSRIGKKPIILPAGVTAEINSGKILISGPKGKLEITGNPKVQITFQDNTLTATVADKSDRVLRALWGTMRALLNNAVTGVSSGFERKLELVSTGGYRASSDKDKITMQLGYSHPTVMAIPKDLAVKVEKNIITVSGIDKEKVGQFAALIREKRPPEPYKGKGLRYTDEVVRRKAGKVVKAVGG